MDKARHTEDLHGIFPIIYTAFHEDGRIDERGERRIVDHLIAAGAHGLAPVGGASETDQMTPGERRWLLEICVDQTAGRVPLVVGCTGTTTQESIDYVKHGAALGVRAAFGLVPYEQQQLKGDAFAEALRRHYLTLGEASSIPIMVQETSNPIPPELVVQIFEHCPNVSYVKEEAPDTAHRITALLQASNGRLRIFSGGTSLLGDLDRGAIGAIPGSIGVADLSTAYDRFQAGDRLGARRAFNHFLPLSTWRRQFNPHGAKEVLRRLGIIESIHSRKGQGQRMDAYDLRELDEIMEVQGPPF
ncbi:MAG TPA: dihydrodipicolinate synthase family protein [Chloroflexota bacterium]|nr:dihydrodipicolinate synthase family protein [Chloroflexota bacterium]